MERSEHQAALEVDRSETNVAQHRAALTVAGQRRQALERLKERQREAHRLQAGRREAAILDEMAINGHLRRAS